MKKSKYERILELEILAGLFRTEMFKEIMDKMWKEAKEKESKTLNM